MDYLSNAFSLQMLDLKNPVIININPVSPSEIPNNAISAIGHVDTAAVVGDILGREVHANRMNLKLEKEDTLFVAQLTGGRLPEGATTLPEGFHLTFVRVTLD